MRGSSQHAALPTRSKFRHNAAFQTQNWDQMLSCFPVLYTSNSPLPITLPLSLAKALPSYRPTFAWRTNGHYLGTFRALNFSEPRPGCVALAFIVMAVANWLFVTQEWKSYMSFGSCFFSVISLKSSGMLNHVDWYVVTYASEYRIASIFSP